MATQILTRTLCDLHLADGVEFDKAVETVTVTLNGESYELDVCTEHAGPIEAVRKTFAEHGRHVPTRGRKRRHAGKTAAETGETFACPVSGCDRTFGTVQGLNMHRVRGHGTAWSDVKL